MNKALIIPIIIIFIGAATYTEILYFPFAVTLVMLVFMCLLTWLNYNSDPDFSTTGKKK